MSTRFDPLPLDAPALLGVRLSGSAGRDARPLLNRLGDRCLERGRLQLVLDLEALSGLGAGAATGLADLQRRLVAAGGEAVFVAVNSGVRHFLDSRFKDLPLRCYRTCGEAVAGLLGRGECATVEADPSVLAGPSTPRAHRFLSLPEALPLLRSATDPAAADEALAGLLQAQELAVEVTCWLRRGDALVSADGASLSADGGLAAALLAAQSALTLFDAAEADLGPSEAELLAERHPDLILPLLREGRLEGLAFLWRGGETSDYGVSESFALDLLMRVLAADAAPAATVGAAPPAGAAVPPAGEWGEELALNLARLLHAARPGGLDWATRAADLVAVTARELGLTDSAGRELAAGALLCDLALLARPELDLAGGRLDSRQWEWYRAHGEAGADMLVAMGAPGPLTELVRHHHERFNGEGYPGTLAGQDIPLGARIVAVVETWIAMTTEMPSRPALPLEQATAILGENVGDRHDPQVVRALLAVVNRAAVETPA